MNKLTMLDFKFNQPTPPPPQLDPSGSPPPTGQGYLNPPKISKISQPRIFHVALYSWTNGQVTDWEKITGSGCATAVPVWTDASCIGICSVGSPSTRPPHIHSGSRHTGSWELLSFRYPSLSSEPQLLGGQWAVNISSKPKLKTFSWPFVTSYC